MDSDGSHSEEAHMDGDYEICLDNRMSTWAEKVVWFEVTIHDPVDDYYDDYIGQFYQPSLAIFIKLFFRLRRIDRDERQK